MVRATPHRKRHVMPLNFNQIGDFFSGLSNDARRALDAVRSDLDRVVDFALDIPDVASALRLDADGLFDALDDAGQGLRDIGRDIVAVGRIDADLARVVTNATSRFGDVAISVAERLNPQATDISRLDAISDVFLDHNESYLALLQIREIGDPDGIISDAIAQIGGQLGAVLSIYNGTQFILNYRSLVDIGNDIGGIAAFDPTDPGAFGQDLGDAITALSTEIAFSQRNDDVLLGVVSNQIAGTASALVDVALQGAADALDAIDINEDAQALLRSLQSQILGVGNQLNERQDARGGVNSALDTAPAGLDATANALQEAATFVAERSALNAVIEEIAESGWDGILDTPFLEAISGDGAIFGELVADIAETVDFEAIGASFQSLTDIDIDLSAGTLDQYGRILNLPPSLITPEMAGVFQQLSPQALAGLGAASGAIFETTTKSAVNGVSEGFDTSIAFLSDLAEQIGDGFLGVVAYLQELLEQYALKVADAVIENVFTPLQQTALSPGEGLIDTALSVPDSIPELLRAGIDSFGGIDGFLDFGEDIAGRELGASARAQVVENLSGLLGIEAETPPLSADITRNGLDTVGGVDFVNLGYAANALVGGGASTFAPGGRFGAYVDALNSDFGAGDLLFGALLDLGVFADLTCLQGTLFDIEADLVATARANLFSDGLSAPIPTEIAAGFDFDARIELELASLLGAGSSMIGISFSALQDVGFVPNATELPEDPSAGFRIDETPDFLRTDVEFGIRPERSDRIRPSEDGGNTLVRREAIWEIDSFAPITPISEDGRNFEAFRERVNDGGLGDGFDPASVEITPAPKVVAEVGSIVIDHQGATVSLEHDSDNPVVFANVQTFNDQNFVDTRIRNVSSEGVEIALEEEEALNFRNSHGTETVGVLAVESGGGVVDDIVFASGTTDVTVDHLSRFVDFGIDFDEAPIIFADLATQQGFDPSRARTLNVTEAGFDVFVEEDSTRDAEIAHGAGSVGFLAFSGSGLIYSDTLDLV